MKVCITASTHRRLRSHAVDGGFGFDQAEVKSYVIDDVKYVDVDLTQEVADRLAINYYHQTGADLNDEWEEAVRLLLDQIEGALN